MPSCLEWGVERREECSEWQTTETEECQAWDQRCCSWQPCRFFCWVVTAVCTVWSNTPTVFCVIWTELTTYICLAWDVVTTVLGFLVTFIESTVGWLVDVIGFIIEIVEAIPVFGALVRWVHNFLTHVIATFLSLPDFVLFWMGIRPEKKLRLCTIVLTDENGQETASAEVVRALLQQAVDIFRREANVRIIPLRSFRLTSGFFGPEVVDNGWIHVDGGPNNNLILDGGCGAEGSLLDFLSAGSGFQVKTATHCFFGSWRRVLGIGAPVTCFFLRSIPGSGGCSLWITDYVTVVGETVMPPFNLSVVGHEVGHACNLWHLCVDNDRMNIMADQGACDPFSPIPTDFINVRMTDWQASRVRASKHVSYL